MNNVLASVGNVSQVDWADVLLHSPVATVLTDGTGSAAAISYVNIAAIRLLAPATDDQQRGETDQRPLPGLVGRPVAELFAATPATLDSLLVNGAAPTDELGQQLVLAGDRLGGDGADGTAHAESQAGDRASVVVHVAGRPDGSGLIIQMMTVRSEPTTQAGAATESMDGDVVDRKAFRRALLELTDLSYSTHDDEVFFQRLLERAVEVVPGAQAGSVQVIVPGTTAFRFVAAVGFDLEGLQRHVLEPKVFFRDARNPVAEIVRDFSVEGRSEEITEWLETVGRLSELVVNVSAPVLVDGSPVAFLSLDNFEDSDAMTVESVEMTTVLSRLIGDLWRRRELEAELRREREAYRHLALHDPLTKLPNRRNLERALDGIIEGARRRGHPSAVLFVDVDDFKSVNDRLGHPVGDAVLNAVAERLTAAARAGDVVGRWGGDEFMLLPRRMRTATEVQDLAKRVLTQFESALELDQGLSYRVRVSIGISWCQASTYEADELLEAADEALYEAKASGKGVARLRQAPNP